MPLISCSDSDRIRISSNLHLVYCYSFVVGPVKMLTGRRKKYVGLIDLSCYIEWDAIKCLYLYYIHIYIIYISVYIYIIYISIYIIYIIHIYPPSWKVLYILPSLCEKNTDMCLKKLGWKLVPQGKLVPYKQTSIQLSLRLGCLLGHVPISSKTGSSTGWEEGHEWEKWLWVCKITAVETTQWQQQPNRAETQDKAASAPHRFVSFHLIIITQSQQMLKRPWSLRNMIHNAKDNIVKNYFTKL